ncbi:response regulator transcription factor [Streptomyces sp. CA-278952]|uniref:response regulator transcription factor n=1 Tax=unclassified Streptomyces TaxID=2593676 RepID=UPI00224282A9|nr:MULTISPECIES: response regulator transcription factor [unclassified Streptomyces]UZI29052.1 response regulator transcription factor [Streptomyces sp. VB1]WDG29001.1 response regulator transcription factor [Streptomyces sp. CA-278952]
MPDDVSTAPNHGGAAAHHPAPQHTSSYIPLTPAPGPAGEPGHQHTAIQHPAAPTSYPAFGGPTASPFPQAPAAPESARLRVVIADDNPVVRAGLGVLLSGRADIQVVAEAEDGREAYEKTFQHRPDVVLLDVRMPGVDGISALPHLVGIAPVLMLTYSRESEIVHEALRLGAGGYLVHGEFTADQLVRAVRDTKDGRANFTATAADALLAHMRTGSSPPRGALPEGLGPALTAAPVPVHAPPRPLETSGSLSQLQPSVGQSSLSGGSALAPNRQQYKLSSREVEVMDLIASGMSNQQIAATCFISEKTVKNHINRIFTKLHSTTRSEAIAHWLGTASRTSGGQP